MGPITTPLTTLLSIKHPILLAGMARTSSGPLAAAVSNAGELGCIGGLGYNPTELRSIIRELKAHLRAPELPFGIDLALPKLDELITVTIEEGARLFISAVGVPPPRVIQRLHDVRILITNMVGASKHVEKVLDADVDIVCAEGDEGGGHTGDIPNSTALVVAAGGIYTGRSLAASLMQGATGVWVGTRFVACVEAGCSQAHKEAVITAGFNETLRILVVSGRPLRVMKNEYIRGWEAQSEEIKELTDKGIVPIEKDFEDGEEADIPFLMGQVAGTINDIKPAAEIVRRS